MGFSEDDRIRAKNAVYNRAYEYFESLVELGYTNSEIRNQVNLQLENSPDTKREEVLKAMLLIVK